MGARLHGEIDFSNCIFRPRLCKQRLKVLRFDEWRGFSLDPCPSQLRRKFYDAYRHDEEMRRVDLVVCSHPAANCELFLPFNVSLLVYATTRLEFGRDDPCVSDATNAMWPSPEPRDAHRLPTLCPIPRPCACSL